MFIQALAKPVGVCLPLFVWSLVLQNPLMTSFIRYAPLKAMLMFVNIGDWATADLYFVILLALLFSYVCFAISYKLPKCGVCLKFLVYALLIFTFVARKFLLHEFGLHLTPHTFSLLQETNGREVSGFFGDYILSSIGLKYLLMILLMSVVVGFSEWFYGKKLQVKIMTKSTILGVFVSIAIIIGVPAILGGYNQLMVASGGQSTFSAIHCTLLKMSKTSVESHAFWNKIEEVNNKSNLGKSPEDTLNVVFVLGESFIKYHSSLYGYPLKTMLYMEQEQKKGNLFVFKDEVSPFNGTSNAMKNLFCLNDLSHGEKWYNCVFWPQLFKKSGFKLYLWDNQKNFDKKHGNTFYEMYSRRVAQLCYDKMNENAFDFDRNIVDDFAKNSKINKDGKNFVWFHLLGQHFAFADKCPENKKVFNIRDIKRKDSYLTVDMKQVIADYDNAVHYTDEVLEKIINFFRSTNSVVVFISDHGEEAYDYRAKASRPAMEAGMEKEYAHCQHDVPMLVWCSDKYKQRHPAIINEMSKCLNNPSMTDKIGYSMLRLANIESPCYRPERDVTSLKFKKSRRIIYLMGGERTLNYDL